MENSKDLMPPLPIPATAGYPQPRFAIMNTCDAPCRRMVCEWVPSVGYCYMVSADEPHMRDYDGMKPSDPTPLESFGFTVEIIGAEVRFTRTRESTAKYENGDIRPWQDRFWGEQFSLRLIKRPVRRSKASGTHAAAGKDSLKCH